MSAVDVPVPPFDPLGLPAPPPLILGLSYLTLTLHLLAMGFTFGSVLLLVWAHLRPTGSAAAQAAFLGTSLPLGFSYLITFGVPPLLFVQVVYGQYFYTSSVLMGGFWILVIPLLIVGYGLAYLHKLTRAARPRPQVWLVALLALCMLAVGYAYVSNFTLMLTPSRWLARYGAHPAGGALNPGEPTVHPRLLLFLSTGLVTAGLGLAWRGSVLSGWGLAAQGRVAQRLGVRSMLIGASLAAVGGIATVVALPPAPRALLAAGGVPTALTGGVVLFLLLAVALAWRSVGRAGQRLPAVAGACLAGSMGCLVVVRDLVRQEYLRPFLSAAALPVRPQWGMFAIFAAALAAGLVLLVALAWRAIPAIAAGSRPTGPASGGT